MGIVCFESLDGNQSTQHFLGIPYKQFSQYINGVFAKGSCFPLRRNSHLADSQSIFFPCWIFPRIRNPIRSRNLKIIAKTANFYQKKHRFTSLK